MEQQHDGGVSRFRHHRSPKSDSAAANKFIGIFSPPPKSAISSPPLELSEHDIFSTPTGSSSPSPTHPNSNPTRNPSNPTRSSQNGILAALNDNLKNRSGFGFGSDARPVFNHKASTSASLSSSSSTSPATSTSSRIMIPRRPQPQSQPLPEIFRHQSAPINIPAMAMRHNEKDRDLDDIVSEEDEEDGVILPPHEVVALRESPMLAYSVLEGAGRTLKGRDLRQVRNAIWRKTGFID